MGLKALFKKIRSTGVGNPFIAVDADAFRKPYICGECKVRLKVGEQHARGCSTALFEDGPPWSLPKAVAPR